MASYSNYRYQFNGVISTEKTVMQNLESLCSAAGSWLAYDIHDGKWSVVINRAGTSAASFNDSNIIGAISITGTGLDALYNSVRVQFPHIDLNDNSDYVKIDIPSADRNSNEPDNTLQLDFEVINDPVQAQLLGFISLKQSRVDKMIKFTTDFSQLGLKAGDLIDITSSIYGFVNKMFRITSIAERDAEDGTIQLDINALEYDVSVYDTDLSRYVVSNSTGIQAIGAIGVPGAIEVDKVERSARPNITARTTSPSGIVEAVEFWYTTDVGIATDSLRAYRLLGTVRPKSGSTFAFGTSVELNVDSLGTGNFLIKARGVNSTTSGPYTAPSGSIYYAPVQVTNAIGPDTEAIDSTGGLVTALSLLSLLNNLDGLFGGDTSIGSLWDKVFSLFNEETGTDLVNTIKNNGAPVSLETFAIGTGTAIVNSKYNAFVTGVNWNSTDYPGNANNRNENVVMGFQVDTGMKQMLMILQTPLGSFDYEYKDAGGTIRTRSNLYAYFPSLVKVYKDDVLIQETTVDWQTQTSILQLDYAGPGFYEVWSSPLPTYDLDQNGREFIFPKNFVTTPQASGDGVTLTAYFFR